MATPSSPGPKRGPGRPRTGKVHVHWKIDPAVRDSVHAAADAEGTDQSSLVEAILRGSRRLKASRPTTTPPEEG